MVAGFFSFQVSYLGRTRLVALVGRETGVAIVRKLASRAMAETNEAALVAIFEHRCMFKTITFDNGAEFHDDRIIEMIHLVKCNFGAPCHSWERGSQGELQRAVEEIPPQGPVYEHDYPCRLR
jgi:IS30 family transposase